MHRGPTASHRVATSALLALAACGAATLAPRAADPAPSAAEIMQSVFANRVRDGGSWRQDNEAFEEGADVPKYWLQVWRYGPGSEVVIVDAYEVRAGGACRAIIHIVYTYDRETGRIQSDAYGAHGLSGHGVTEFDGTVTASEVTLRLPGGGEMRMLDREDHGAGDAVVVEAERWSGDAWVPAEPATWRRSTAGPPCDDPGTAGIGH